MGGQGQGHACTHAAAVVLLAAVCCAAAAGGARAQDPREYIERQMAEGDIPGCSVAAYRGDSMLYHDGFGSSWPEEGGAALATTAQTAFTHASISKTITGVAVMILRERGLVDLSADINEYLPYTVAVAGITLEQLMTHTSSIVDDYYFTIPCDEIYTDHDPLIPLRDFNEDMFVEGRRWFSTRTFSGTPGQRYSYSNIGSSLAASVVEEVVKTHELAPDYNAFVQEAVFRPLGATQGSHYLRDFEQDMEPTVGARPSEFFRGSFESWNHYAVPDYPNGFWRANAETTARMMGMVANDGVWQGTRVLSSASVEYIRTRAAPPNDGGRQGQAFFYYAGGTSPLLGHGGAELGIATEAYFDVGSGVGAVVLTNGDFEQGNAFEQALWNILEHLIETFAPARPAPSNTTAAASSRTANRTALRRVGDNRDKTHRRRCRAGSHHHRRTDGDAHTRANATAPGSATP